MAKESTAPARDQVRLRHRRASMGLRPLASAFRVLRSLRDGHAALASLNLGWRPGRLANAWVEKESRSCTAACSGDAAYASGLSIGGDLRCGSRIASRSPGASPWFHTHRRAGDGAPFLPRRLVRRPAGRDTLRGRWRRVAVLNDPTWRAARPGRLARALRGTAERPLRHSCRRKQTGPAALMDRGALPATCSGPGGRRRRQYFARQVGLSGGGDSRLGRAPPHPFPPTPGRCHRRHDLRHAETERGRTAASAWHCGSCRRRRGLEAVFEARIGETRSLARQCGRREPHRSRLRNPLEHFRASEADDRAQTPERREAKKSGRRRPAPLNMLRIPCRKQARIISARLVMSYRP